MQDIHFVHVLQALTDLSDEHHSVQLHQSVVFINDPVEQLPSTHTKVRDKWFKKKTNSWTPKS